MDIEDTSRYYRGNPNLLSPNAVHHYTAEELQEVVKCANDPIYFIKNYVKIVSVDDGIIPFKLWGYQENLIKSIHTNRNTICLAPRQVGKTETCIAYYLWAIIFQKSYSIGILANKADTAKDILSRLQGSLELLPDFLKPGIEEYNVFSLKLKNGSKITASATSSSANRGKAFSMLHLDEFAFIPNNMAEDFFTSVLPTLSSGKKTKMVIVSTPNGFNMFHTIWKKALNGTNGFNPIEIPWNARPGRDEKWKKEQIAIQGPRKFAQEFGNDFQGSSNTLVDPIYISAMVDDIPLAQTAQIRIYSEPIPGHVYTLVADPSEGLGQDYSTFIIYDITAYPITIAAVFRDNKTTPLMFPTIIYRMGRKYNDAALLIESNNMGGGIVQTLHYEMEYPNVVSFGYHNPQMGIKTTKTVKRVGCNIFKEMVENQKLIINDLTLIEEISKFTQQKNSYAADEGWHDDLVMTGVLLAYFTTTPEFKHLTDTDLRLEILKLREQSIEDDVLPFGYGGYHEFEQIDQVVSLSEEGFFDQPDWADDERVREALEIIRTGIFNE